MKFVGMSLAEVAAAVATHLKTRDIEVVVVGGSAITSHVPDVYTSMDIDLAVTSGIDRRKIGRALDELGFKQRGRVFETRGHAAHTGGGPHVARDQAHSKGLDHRTRHPVLHGQLPQWVAVWDKRSILSPKRWPGT